MHILRPSVHSSLDYLAKELNDIKKIFNLWKKQYNSTKKNSSKMLMELLHRL
jgi:hypothetical protein